MKQIRWASSGMHTMCGILKMDAKPSVNGSEYHTWISITRDWLCRYFLKHGKKNGILVSMREVWVAADVVVSPLGNTSEENFNQLRIGVSGITILNDISLSPTPVAAGKVTSVKASSAQSRFEIICLNLAKQ